MNYKLLRKRLILSSIGLGIFVTILFFIFIAPNRTPAILMYHAITVERKDNPLTLPEDIFERQMEYLSKHDYRIVSLKEVARMIQEGGKIPNNWVVLTFDDWSRNFNDMAYPILKACQFNATAFATVDSLEKNQNRQDWRLLEQLAKDDLIDVGSHSLSHRLLPLLDLKEAKKEVFLSKVIFEKKLKEPVDSFAYPFGAADDSIKKMIKEAGYKVAVGAAYQRGQFKNYDIYVLKRVFVSKLSKYPFVFRFMVSGYYIPTRELILRVLNIKTPRALYAAKSSGGIYKHKREKK